MSRSSFFQRPCFFALVLVAAVGAVYFNSLRGAFVWDDLPSIVDNRSIEHLASALAKPAAVNTTSGRPLVALSLALNYAIGGRSLLGFHLLNVLIHAAAALALFGFVRQFARLPKWEGRFAPHATELAVGVAALWALHPLQTQAVTYVIQRAESLMALCYLLTLWLFLRSVSSPRPAVWRTLAVIACALGMTAKEVMVSAPVIVLALDLILVSGATRPAEAFASKKVFYTALFSTWLILFWLVASLGGNRDGSTGGLAARAAWLPYWLTQFPAIAAYLKLAFFPHPLIFQYGAAWLPNAAAALPAALFVLPLVVLTAVALWRWPAIGFLGFWFFSVLAVTSLIPGTVDMIVEYRMYLALAPLWILVVGGLYAWRPSVARWIVIAAAVVFATLTVARNRDYRSPLSLWADTVAKRPGNALARYNLAVSLLNEPGRAAEARAELESALRLNPNLGMAHYNLALLLSQQPAETDKAIAQYEEALRIEPRYSQAHNNLGTLLDQRGDLDQAGRQFQLAVQYDSDNLTAWVNLVRVLEESGRPDQAISTAEALVRGHPNFGGGQACLGIALANQRRETDALPHLEEAVRLDPTQWMARYYLGSMLALRGERPTEAVALLREAARERPDNPGAHFSLAHALAADPQSRQEARVEILKVLQLDPQFSGAKAYLEQLNSEPK